MYKEMMIIEIYYFKIMKINKKRNIISIYKYSKEIIFGKSKF